MVTESRTTSDEIVWFSRAPALARVIIAEGSCYPCRDRNNAHASLLLATDVGTIVAIGAYGIGILAGDAKLSDPVRRPGNMQSTNILCITHTCKFKYEFNEHMLYL